MDPEPEDEPLSEVNPEPEDEPLSEVDPEPEDENENRDHVLSCIEEDTILCEFVRADDTIAIGLTTVCLSTQGRGDKTTCVNATSPPPNDKAYCGCCEEENDEVTGECPDEEEDEPQSDLIIVA